MSENKSKRGGKRDNAGRKFSENKAKPLTSVVRCPVGYEQHVKMLPDLMNLIAVYEQSCDTTSPRWDKAKDMIEEMRRLLGGDVVDNY